MKKISFKVVVTEPGGETWVVNIKAFAAQQAERVSKDSLSYFYGEPFAGSVNAIL